MIKKTDVIVWNTGRKYSLDGQIIAAKADVLGKVYFMDDTRKIDGELKGVILDGDNDVRGFVMAHYDAGLYNDGLHGKSRFIRDELREAIKDYKDKLVKYKIAKIKEDIDHGCDGPVTQLVAVCRAVAIARNDVNMDEALIAEALLEVMNEYGWIKE